MTIDPPPKIHLNLPLRWQLRPLHTHRVPLGCRYNQLASVRQRTAQAEVLRSTTGYSPSLAAPIHVVPDTGIPPAIMRLHPATVAVIRDLPHASEGWIQSAIGQISRDGDRR